MTYAQRYVGSGGSDANDGTTVALRKLTIQAMETALSAATRYTINIRQGTYRELVTLGVSGPTPYSTGTVSVTNGSAIVTGSGTTWTTNTELNDWFQSQVLAHGTDGVTLAVTATSHTFTSVAGNFQAGHIGTTLRIGTIGAYVITARASATSITIAKPDNSSFLMVAGVTLVYDVGPESPYKITSVDSDTQITLTEAWSGPTLTGLAYQVWGHVEYVGDYSGAVFSDAFGAAPVRITGSADDIALTRTNCVTATSKNQRTFRGCVFDGSSGAAISQNTACSNWVVDGCYFSCSSNSVSLSGTGTGNTVQRCNFTGSGSAAAVLFTHTSTVDNVAGLVQNCIFHGGGQGIRFVRIGGVLARNSKLLGISGTGAIVIGTALTVGQATTVNNSVFNGCSNAVSATATGEIIENYNNFFANTANRSNVLTGANSAVNITLFDTRWFFQLIYAQAAAQVISPFDWASYCILVNVAGLNPPLTDLRGTAVQGAQREWGAFEYLSTLAIQNNFVANTPRLAGMATTRGANY